MLQGHHADVRSANSEIYTCGISVFVCLFVCVSLQRPLNYHVTISLLLKQENKKDIHFDNHLDYKLAEAMTTTACSG